MKLDEDYIYTEEDVREFIRKEGARVRAENARDAAAERFRVRKTIENALLCDCDDKTKEPFKKCPRHHLLSALGYDNAE